MLLCPHFLAPWERIHPQLFSPDMWTHVVNSVGDRRKHQDGKYKEWLCQAICLAVLNKGREKGWLLDSGKYESSFWKQYFTTELVILVTMVIVATLAAVNTDWELSLCQAQGWVFPMHLIYLRETQENRHYYYNHFMVENRHWGSQKFWNLPNPRQLVTIKVRIQTQAVWAQWYYPEPQKCLTGSGHFK